MQMDDFDEFVEYESGPFCRHWGNPSFCEEVCARCGHGCTRHEFQNPSPCMDCSDCEEWVEVGSVDDVQGENTVAP